MSPEQVNPLDTKQVRRNFTYVK